MRHEEMMRPDEYRVMFELEDQYWWYRGVRALLQTWLERYTPRTARLLDGGCGTGANLQLLQRYGRALGVDIAESAIDFCRARGIAPEHLALASLTELPFPDHFFDVVISFEVVCNITDDQQAFDEIARVLKSDGWAIIKVPAYPWLWSRHDIAVGHKRRYTARDLRAKLVRAGMRIERLTHTNVVMLVPIILKRLFSRLEYSHKVNSDLAPLPHGLNALLSALYVAEMHFVARVDVPCGVSLVALARKDGGRRTKGE